MLFSMAVVLITVIILTSVVIYRENINFKNNAKRTTEFIAQTIGERLLPLILENEYQEAGKIVKAILENENRILAVRVREKSPIGLKNVIIVKNDIFDITNFDEKASGFSKNFYYHHYIMKLGKEVKGDIQICYSLNEMFDNIRKFNLLVLIVFFICIIFALIVSSFISNIMVRPIIAFTKSAEKIASGNLREEIKINNKDEIGELSRSFEIMREKIKEHIEHLDKKVLERTQAITDLLDNAGQGFLSFNRSMIIYKEYSKECVEIFEKRIESMNILELLFPETWSIYNSEPEKLPPDDMLLLFKEAFLTYFDYGKEVAFKILNEELKYKNKILKIKFVALANSGNEKKIMLIVTDITTEKRLEKKAQFEEERNKYIVKVALDKKSFIFFIKDLNNIFNKLQKIINKEELSFESIQYLFRLIHTIKGNASFFNLNNVVSKAHSMEDYLLELQTSLKYSDSQVIEKLNSFSDELISSINDYLDLIKDFLSKDEILKEEKIFEITESRINWLIDDIVSKNISAADKQYIIQNIKDLKRMSMEFVLRRFVVNAEQLGKKLNKKLLPIQVNNINLQFDYYYFKPVIDTFVHLIRNAVDHGIEFPGERKKRNKSSDGKIVIFIDEKRIDNKLHFIFQISDDGRGIDIEKIKAVILKKNILTQSKLDSLSRDEILMYIFDDGFSSKEDTTEISGRGVGLSAVKSLVERYKGKIEISTELDKGTTITILLPYPD